jgi:methionyl-tRNA formyltransferase
VSEPKPQFDLLLGSEIGLWIVSVVDPRDVGTVITKDSKIARASAARGLNVADGPAKEPGAPYAVSAHWPTVLSADELGTYRQAWNLHPGLLPWGRGYGPVFWAIWAGEPAGATLHAMSAALDRGPIVDRRPVPVYDNDTGGSLYRRVLEARENLFLHWWPRLLAGERPVGEPQPEGGSYHARAELVELRDAAVVESLSAADLIRLARALAMPGKPGVRVGPSCRLAYVEE